MRQARGTPAPERPPASAWLEGPHAARIRAIEDFALQRADARQQQLALTSLQVSANALTVDNMWSPQLLG